MLATLILLSPLCSCQDLGKNKTGSNTNWLQACSKDGDCSSEAFCLCGSCSAECSSDGDCGALGGARCVTPTDPALGSICNGEATAPTNGMCLPACEPGSCQTGHSCVLGSCVPAPIPDTDFCAPAAGFDAESQALEEELLDLVLELRQQGGVSCSGVTTGPTSLPRLDGRLSCAARVFALDAEQTRTTGNVDSLGRTGSERLALAGYTPAGWWESHVLSSSSPADALQGMLEDEPSCPEIAGTGFRTVGAGRSGTVYVLTLADGE